MKVPGANRVHVMNMNDSTQFINVRNSKKTHPLGIQWILEGPVAVMVASNLGRPGGKCSQTMYNCNLKREQFVYEHHPDATTQEESILSFVHENTPHNSSEFEDQLSSLSCIYGMKSPTGNPQSDFDVRNGNGSCFNVRTSEDPGDYAREFGHDITILSPYSHTTHKIYMSYIAGPNAKGCPKTGWGARLPITKEHGIKKLDTVFRTISRPACEKNSTFKTMLLAAIVSSLKSMAEQGHKRVIMAAPSSGLYAGKWGPRIQKEYHGMCMIALKTMHSSNGYTFNEVLVPLW
jgi:hypothetical protein